MFKLNSILSRLLSILLLGGFSSGIWAGNWLQQQWEFKEAQRAFLTKDKKTFNSLLTKLEAANYPIAFYLRSLDLKANLDKSKEIKKFILDHPDSSVTETLRQTWLKHLAQKKEWPTFLAAYTPQTDTALQCYHLQAQFETQQSSSATLEAARTLWLLGKPHPDECNPLFTYLSEKGVLNGALHWQRTQLAMQNGTTDLVTSLAKNLTDVEQQTVAKWQAVREKPAKELEDFSLPPAAPFAKEVLLYGLERLAKEDSKQALETWCRYEQRYDLLAEEDGEKTFRYLAMKAAQQNLPNAGEWLAKIDNTLINEDVQQAQLQTALAHADWAAVLTLTQPLLTAEDLKWRYWHARALDQSDQTKEARPILEALAKERHYYGFLAAQHLQLPYAFKSQPLELSEELKTQLLARINVSRARELHAVGLTELARQEWQIVLETLTVEELKGAALLARQWGWYDRAIVTATKIKAFDDLALRFPTPYYDTVSTLAEAQHLDTALVYAIMRQESAFQTDSRSTANALGLMQMLPTTAKEVAGKLGVKFKEENDLFNPELNIRLGTGFLRSLLDKFKGNRVLAIAGYNAGPSRAKQWASERACLETDIWIERIPFKETRDYVQRVLSYAPIFEFQWIKDATQVSMPLDKLEGEKCPKKAANKSS